MYVCSPQDACGHQSSGYTNQSPQLPRRTEPGISLYSSLSYNFHSVFRMKYGGYIMPSTLFCTLIKKVEVVSMFEKTMSISRQYLVFMRYGFLP